MCGMQGEEFDELLAGFDPKVAAVARLLRDELGRFHPFEYRMYWGWKGLGCHDADTGYVCGIFPRAHSVFLSFARGTLLPDPGRRLIGGGRTVRSLEFQPGEPVSGWEPYVAAALKYARPTAGSAGRR